MNIAAIAAHLESLAPLALQESYDNAGLILGDPLWECTGILCALDVTEAVVNEATASNCNCIVAHHPLIFRAVKKINGADPVGRTIIAAIKNNIAIYAAHTNLDNIAGGVNGKIADRLELGNRKILDPKPSLLKKLVTFVPDRYLEQVRSALFAAGAGRIGPYSECSFTSPGLGTFRPEPGAKPFSGTIGKRRDEQEIKLEVIFPADLEGGMVAALTGAHPYEMAAYDIISLANKHPEAGSGLIGQLPVALAERDFLALLQQTFEAPGIRHTPVSGKVVSRVALCGGAGSFLMPNALQKGADAFVTADLKYHDFFEPDGSMLVCDIGHYESEQYTVDLLIEILLQKFTTFAVLKSKVNTNPVNYFRD